MIDDIKFIYIIIDLAYKWGRGLSCSYTPERTISTLCKAICMTLQDIFEFTNGDNVYMYRVEPSYKNKARS